MQYNRVDERRLGELEERIKRPRDMARGARDCGEELLGSNIDGSNR